MYDNTNARPKAAGFLNLSGIDANGNEFKLRKGIPLETQNVLERSLLNAALNNPEFSITLTGVVNVQVDSATVDDIEFAAAE